MWNNGWPKKGGLFFFLTKWWIMTRRWITCDQTGGEFYPQNLNCNPPSLGKTMRYSALHCGQVTRAVLLPRCFSSTQRCRQAWWTHLVEPRQWQGRTHSAVRSSSSVAKHTQQLLKTNTHEDGEAHTANTHRLLQIRLSVHKWSWHQFHNYFPNVWTNTNRE